MKYSRILDILCVVLAIGAGIVFYWRTMVSPETMPEMVPSGAQNAPLTVLVGAVLAAGLTWLLLRGLLALWRRR